MQRGRKHWSHIFSMKYFKFSSRLFETRIALSTEKRLLTVVKIIGREIYKKKVYLKNKAVKFSAGISHRSVCVQTIG